MRRTPAVVAASTLLLLATACGGSGGGGKKEPKADDTPPQGSAQCHHLLATDRVERLAGGTVADPEDTEVGGMEACQWKGTTDPGASVTIVRAPAEQWAAKLPPLIDQLQETGALAGIDKDRVKRLRQVLAQGGAMTGDQACEAFSTVVVELGGGTKGADRVVLWRPDRKAPQALTLQECEDGRYTSITLIAGGLKGNAAEEERIAEAYDSLPS